MEHSDKRIDERIDEINNNYIALEKKVNETITMVNQLILNVNGANQFVAGLHNALHKAGFIESPEQMKKEADKLLEVKEKDEDVYNDKLYPEDCEPEPEMDEIN